MIIIYICLRPLLIFTFSGSKKCSLSNSSTDIDSGKPGFRNCRRKRYSSGDWYSKRVTPYRPQIDLIRSGRVSEADRVVECQVSNLMSVGVDPGGESFHCGKKSTWLLSMMLGIGRFLAQLGDQVQDTGILFFEPAV